jgi:hypothetical protein
MNHGNNRGLRSRQLGPIRTDVRPQLPLFEMYQLQELCTAQMEHIMVLTCVQWGKFVAQTLSAGFCELGTPYVATTSSYPNIYYLVPQSEHCAGLGSGTGVLYKIC